jgi:ribosomal protein S18 acetylase RimI-like enzyme
MIAPSYPAVMSHAEPGFLIRLVRPDEYRALGDLTVAAYHGVAADMPHQDQYDLSLRDVARRAESSCVAVAVAPDGRLLGGVTYVRGPEDSYSEDLREDEAGIRMLAIDPEFQGRGVGRALTVWCLHRARRDGRARIALHTSHFMPMAVRLYERLGFSRRPDRDFSPVAGVDLVAYAFDLGEPDTGTTETRP